MKLATLQDKIEETVKSGKPKQYFNLMGTENFRVWLNVFMPGEGTNGLSIITTRTKRLLSSKARAKSCIVTAVRLKWRRAALCLFRRNIITTSRTLEVR